MPKILSSLFRLRSRYSAVSKEENDKCHGLIMTFVRSQGAAELSMLRAQGQNRDCPGAKAATAAPPPYFSDLNCS
jgi:hypothetical protein